MNEFRKEQIDVCPVAPVSFWIRWIFFGGVLIAFGSAYLFFPGFRTSFHQVTGPIAKGDLSALENFILSFGWWAPVVSFLLMILQTLIAPLPAFVLAMANAMAFGVLYGFLLTCSSALAAAFLAFYLSRCLGRPIVEKTLLGVKALRRFDSLAEDFGAWGVLILRLFPVVSFDFVSFSAGLTAMGPGAFGLATLVGILPAAVAFSLLGNSMHSANRWTFIGGAALLGILIVGAACARKYVIRQKP